MAEKDSELATTKPAGETNKDLQNAGNVNPMQNAATMVRKYATGLINDKRAQQFAFQLSIMTKDPKNGDKLLRCTGESVISAMMACVHLDLMPNTSEGYAYIIPYGNTAQFQLGYKGLVELAYRSGIIKTINAELVFPEDDFDYSLGTDRKLTHKPSLKVKDRTDYNAAIGVYATAKLDNGEFVFEVMTKPDIEKTRKSAQSSSGPWKDWPEAMAKKTVVKRLLKLLPSSSEDNRFKQASQWDSTYEAGGHLKVDDKGGIIDGEIIDAPTLPVEVTDAIAKAETREDLKGILADLPVEQRKLATDLVNARIKEISEAKKQA